MKNETKRRIRLISWILFVMYILLLVYFLFLSEEYGRQSYQVREYRYNLVFFREIHRFLTYWEMVGFWSAMLNICGNIIGFIPFGFFLPILQPRCKRVWVVVLSGMLVSLLVESIQLISKVGCFDVDDIFLNTLGVLIGVLWFCICNWLRRLLYEKKI